MNAADQPDTSAGATISPASVAMLAAAVPAGLFALTYLMAAVNGHVGWCLPLVGNCTDITHTGLQPPESFVFRIGMVVVCVLFVALWKLVGDSKLSNVITLAFMSSSSLQSMIIFSKFRFPSAEESPDGGTCSGGVGVP